MPDLLHSFVYEVLPSRVVFGPGKLRTLPAELERLGVHKALIVSTPRQWRLMEQVDELTHPRIAAVFDGALGHIPSEAADAGRAAAAEHQADCLIALGGGSATGLAKAIAFTTRLPILAVPTTYSGSEVTPIWGLTENGIKHTARDLHVLPKVVIYDPELTLTLPVATSVTSGINAIAHCVEALYAEQANPVISMLAEEGIRAMAAALPAIQAMPADITARSQALYAAWLAGAALGSVGMALHHKLCHTLGGSFGLPHAETHTVILPHAIAYNAPAVPAVMARIADALGSESAARGVFDLAKSLNAPTSLAALGMQESDFDRAAELAVQAPYFNPQPVTRDGIRHLLSQAFAGQRP